MTGRDQTKTVFLDEYGSYPITISPQAFTQIEELVKANRVCRICAKPYAKDRPMVTRNTCLTCFLHSEMVRREKQLTFAGEYGQDQSGDTQYKFIDADGYVFLTDSGSETTKLDRSPYYTLLHWGFIVPETITRNDKEKQLTGSSWYIYGDFRHNPVIVCKYHEYYGDHLEVVFLVYKDKLAVEVNKRLKAIQQLFQKARSQIEATRDKQGRYHYGDGYTTYHLEESHLYPIISDILSSEIRPNTE